MEYLCDLCGSPSIVRLVNNRRQQWTGKVIRMGEMNNAYRISMGSLLGNVLLEERE
jgi:hypothetical protein